jgi:hypothetical protein
VRRLVRRLIRVRLSRAPSYDSRRGWLLELALGRGAGYRWGATAFVGRWVLGGAGNMYTARPWAAGLTTNANRLPWVRS